MRAGELVSEYRRFIAYIYEYEKGRKSRNTGFVKADARNGMVRMQIRVQSGNTENQKAEAYGFVREKEELLGIRLGELVLKKGRSEVRLLVPEQLPGESGYRFEDLSGLWIQTEDRIFATVWDEESIDPEQFVPWEKRQEKSKENIEEKNGEKAVEMDPEPVQAQNVEGSQASAAAVSLASRWEQFRYHYPHEEPFQDDEITQCVRIAPKDLDFLGEEERMFCRSPFVQQKYMKYRHLLLGLHRNGRFIVAVPGVNRNIQDQNLAAMYGFPEFKAGQEAPFGYWYHFLAQDTGNPGDHA